MEKFILIAIGIVCLCVTAIIITLIIMVGMYDLATVT